MIDYNILTENELAIIRNWWRKAGSSLHFGVNNYILNDNRIQNIMKSGIIDVDYMIHPAQITWTQEAKEEMPIIMFSRFENEKD